MSHIPFSNGHPFSSWIPWSLTTVLSAVAIWGLPSQPQDGTQTPQTRPTTRPATRPAPAPETRETRPATRTAETGPYRSNEFGFSIQFPAGWEIKEKAEGCAAIAISPKENPRDEFREHVAVCVEEVPDGAALKEYVDRTVEKYKTNLNAFELNDQREAALGTAKGWQVIYGFAQGVTPVRNTEYFVLVHGRAFIVRGSSEASKFDANKAALETVAKSLTLQ